MPKGKPTALTIALTPEDRRTLEAWQRAPTCPVRRARRARLVLLLEAGGTITGIADTVGISRRHVYKWARRFLAHGVAGLADRPKGRYAARRATRLDDADFPPLDFALEETP